jgi:hypothetical protein
MQLSIVSNGKKRKRKEKRRTSVQYSITQIDRDKAIVETVLYSPFSFVRIASKRTQFEWRKKERKWMQKYVKYFIVSNCITEVHWKNIINDHHSSCFWNCQGYFNRYLYINKLWMSSFADLEKDVNISLIRTKIICKCSASLSFLFFRLW